MAVVAVTMGVHYRWEFPPILQSQLRLAHQLREELVTAQLEVEETLRGVWSQVPQVAAAEEALALAQQEVSAAEQVVADLRGGTRRRVTGPPATRLAQARRAVREARVRRRSEISLARPVVDPQIRQIHEQLYARHKQLYKQFCTDGDLFWATFNEVVANHKSTMKKITAQRKQGRSANLKRRRFDGTGTLTVQLQREAGGPARTPAAIADPDGRYRNLLVVPWTDPHEWAGLTRAEQRRRGRVTVRMRCGRHQGHPVWLQVPVQQHRMLAADAEIVLARLTVSRVSDQRRAQISVVARIDDAPGEVSAGPDVAVRLGWRDGGEHLIVADWRSSRPISIAAHLREVISVDPDGMTGQVRLPRSVPDQVAHAATLGAGRIEAMRHTRAAVVDWLTEHGPVPHPSDPNQVLSPTEVARWASPARLAWLHQQWTQQPPDDADIIATLEQWRHNDIPVWRRQEHARTKALRRRRDLYRQVAAHLVGLAGRVVVDDLSLPDIAAAAARGGTALHPQVRRRVAQRRAVVAPGSLRELLIAAAHRDGVEVVTVSASGLATTHPQCGHTSSTRTVLDGAMVCQGCGHRYDQHRAATATMLTRASGDAPTAVRDV